MFDSQIQYEELLNDDKFIDKQRVVNFLQGFFKFYREKEFVDVIFCVDEIEFLCYKNVFVILSFFFMVMFFINMVESY